VRAWRQRARQRNFEGRITGNGSEYIVEEIVRARKKGMALDDLRQAIELFIASQAPHITRRMLAQRSSAQPPAISIIRWLTFRSSTKKTFRLTAQACDRVNVSLHLRPHHPIHFPLPLRTLCVAQIEQRSTYHLGDLFGYEIPCSQRSLTFASSVLLLSVDCFNRGADKPNTATNATPTAKPSS
jgi:hypothetical protein